MKTLQERQRGFGAGGLVRFLVVVVVFFVLIGSLGQCVQQLPQVAGDLAGQVGGSARQPINAGNGNAGVSVAPPADDNWSKLKRAVGRIAGEIAGLWDSTEDADKIKIFCKTMPVDGVDKFCDSFAAAVGTATEMRRERIACLWQAAHNSQGLPGIASELQIQNTCAAFRRDPSGLETCLQGQVDSGMANQCLATAPGQFWRSRGMIKPLACPDNLPGVQCDQQPQAQEPYEYHAPYLQCLSDTSVRFNDRIKAAQCAEFSNPAPPGRPDARKWDQCMVDAITQGLGPEVGPSWVRACENLKPKWWQLSYWL